MEKQILIIGPTGNVGKELVKALHDQQEPIRLGVRDLKKSRAIFSNEIPLVTFNYDDSTTYHTALKGATQVFMLAPPIVPGSVEKATQFIDAAKSENINKIVFLSASAVEVNDSLPLGEIEKYIKESSIPYTILRPTWFMENFSNWAATSVKETGNFYLPAGTGKAAFISVCDIGQVAARVLTDLSLYTNQTITLTGSEPLDHHQVAGYIGKAIGKDVQYIDVSGDAYINTLLQWGQPESYANFLVYLFSMIKDNKENRTTYYAKEILQRDPVTFAEYVDAQAASWK